MAKQSLVWTALPNGYTPDGKALRLSVLLSPRLDPEGNPPKLGSFPDWADWPRTLRKARFEITSNGHTVTVAGDGSGSTHRIDPRLGVADSVTWKALFTPDLPVTPFVFTDHSHRGVTSYGAADMAELVQALYANLAAQADGNLPRASDFSESRDWGLLVRAVRDLDHPSPVIASPRVGAAPGVTASPTTLANFKDFHTPLSAPFDRTEQRKDDKRIATTWREYNRPPMPAKADLHKQIDFHQVVAAMGSYPTLLRRLGLVMDFVLAKGSFKSGNDVKLSVKVVFTGGGLITPSGAGVPVTHMSLSSTQFQAVSDTNADFPLTGRLLDLDPARFALLPVDVDGAGLKVMNFARSLGRRNTDDARVDPVTRQEDELGAPTLRSVGLMLVQRQRAKWLTNRFIANKQRNGVLESQMQGGSGIVELHAEDLVRGYRIDVWDGSAKKWASLCRRTAHYEFNGVVVEPTPEEESTIRLAATTSADTDPKSSSNISLHEALATWNGWSLAAPPPGRTILPDDSVDTQDESQAELPPGMTFMSRFKAVKGSLPRLRFGRRYWMRARAVDLAGNSLDWQPTDFGGEQPDVRAQPYLRYEPLAPPVLALRSQDGMIDVPAAGESMARMAIRSFNDSAADNTVPSPQRAYRAGVTPRVSAREAEQHGMLDKGGLVDAGTFQMLAHDRDLDGHDPNAVIREVKLPLQGPLGTAPADTSFAVHEIGRAMTYLPDPLAAEVAVRIFMHPNIDNGEIIRIPLYTDGAWPDARAFVVEVFEDAVAKPSFDSGSRHLLVPLPKAVRARIRMSMTLSDAALASMGVFAWLDGPGQDAQRQRAQDGQHWMLTPWRDLEVVHAVQRPLKTPDIMTVGIRQRLPGDTHALPVMRVQCSIASTDRLDLLAAWHDPSDDAAMPGDVPRQDAALQIKVTDDLTYATDFQGSPAGGYPDHTIGGPDLLELNVVDDPRITVKPHEFHDSRYRRIEYWFDATTRFREFLPAALLTTTDGSAASDAQIKVTGARSVTWIPSSAPPPGPRVLYVLPIFGWSRDQDAAGNAVSRRHGGGLRVYLDRGWNASGYGEMLAVVLPPADFAGDPNTMPGSAPLAKYVTQWGSDPVWDSAFVAGIAPRRGDFPQARTAPDTQGAWLPPGAPASESDQLPGAFKVTGLAPPGLPKGGAALEVAPHDVAWDADRALWYCDIEVNAGQAYFPFIRLALARYQPVSIDGAHLSTVVLADFMALAPERWLVVATAADARSRLVTVSGYSYRAASGWQEASQAPGSAAVAKSSVVEVWVEQLEPRLGVDFGWQRLAEAVVTPTAGPGPAGGSADVLWTGQVTVPQAAGQARQLRLVVAEYEDYLVDDATPYDQTPTRKGRRLVFTEHHTLDL